MKSKKLLGVLRGGLEIGLIAVLAVVCGPIVWQIAAPSEVLGIPVTYSAPQKNFALVAGADLSILTQYDPFTANVTGTSSDSHAAENAPETSLNLTLKGVRSASDGTGVAFILLPDNRQLRAEIGDEILDGVALEYVFADRVTLRVRGELENLYRREPGASSGILAADGASVTADAATVRDVSSAAFLGGVNLVPVRESGVRNGYRLTPRADANVLISAGFEPGDIIRQINNRAISQMDSEDLQELMLSTAQIDFDLERAGEAARVSVRFSER